MPGPSSGPLACRGKVRTYRRRPRLAVPGPRGALERIPDDEFHVAWPELREEHGDPRRAVRLLSEGEDRIHEVVVTFLAIVTNQHADGILLFGHESGLLHDENSIGESIVDTVFVFEGLNGGELSYPTPFVASWAISTKRPATDKPPQEIMTRNP